MSNDERRGSWDPAAFPERRTGDSRRAHPRLKVSLTVRGSGRASREAAEAIDLSVGGLALVLPEAIPVGAQAELTIEVPGSNIPVTVLGEVVDRIVQKGSDWEVGVRFLEMDPSDARLIEAYVDRLRRSAGASD
jgi:c-di-GMP-binding flagellar brake protein YcgR